MKIKVRLDRGMALLGYLKYFFAGFGFKFIASDQWLSLIITAIVFAVTGYLLGDLDLRIGIWRLEAEYVTREVNPFFKKLEKDINSKNKH